jgi:hypothetical protein
METRMIVFFMKDAAVVKNNIFMMASIHRN